MSDKGERYFSLGTGGKLMNKKYRLIVALLLIVCLVCVAFAGCEWGNKDEPKQPDDIIKPDVPPDDGGKDIIDEPEKLSYTASQIMGFVVTSLSNEGELANFEIEMDCATNGKEETTKILIQANIIGDSNLQFSLKAMKDDQITFGMYIVDDKLFIDLGDEVLYLEDFNMVYLVDILGNALGLIDLSNVNILGMGINDLLSMVYGIVFSSPTTTVLDNGDVQFGLKIELNSLLNTLLPLVQGFIPTSDIYTLNPIFDWLRTELPQVGIDISVLMGKDLKNPSLKSLGVNITDREVGENQGNTILDLNATVEITSEKVSIGIPETVNNFVPFSFTNIRTQIDFKLASGTADEGNRKADVGKIINIFSEVAGSEQILPEGLLFLEAELGFRLKVNIDLDLNYANLNVDNNLILIEIYSLSLSGEESENPLLGIYYRDGALYVSLDKLLPNYWGTKNIRVDVSISDLIVGVVNKLTTLIDDALGTKWSEANANEIAQAALSGVTIVEEGEVVEPVISDTLSSFITAVASVLYMEDYIKANGNSISVTANSDFIKKILSIASVDTDIIDKFPDFGAAVLSLNFGENFNISLDVNVNEPGGDNIYLGLMVHSFGIGREDKDLKANIESKTQSNNFTSSVTDIIYDLLKGTELNAGMSLSFNKGVYNLANLLTMFGLDAFEQTEILWEFTENSRVNIDLKLGLQLDFVDHSKSEFVLEIKSRETIMVGGQEAYPADTVIMGMYGINNKLYVDLSELRIAQIHLPKIAVDIDFTSIIASLLSRYVSDMTLEFDIAKLLGLSNGDEVVELPEEMSAAIFADESGETLTPAGEILIGLNADALTVNFSLNAIFALLKALNVGDISIGDIDLMGNITASHINGIILDIDGEILKPLNNELNNTGLSNLKIKLEAGTANYPIKFGGADLNIGIVDADYATDDLIGAIVDMASKVSLEGSIELTTEDTKIDFAQIVNNILAASGQEFTLPITLSLDDWQSKVTLNVAWKLNFRQMAETKLLLEFKYEQKLLIGAYLHKNQIALDLSGLGFFKIKIVNSPIVSYLVNTIDELLSDLGEMNLTELINGLLKDNGIITDEDIANGNAGSNMSEPLMSFYANDLGQTELTGPRVDQELAKKLTEAMAKGDTMSIVAVILNCVSVQNTDIIVSFQEDLVDALLRSLLGVGLGVDVSLLGAIKMTDGEADLTVKVDKITCAINLKLKVGDNTAGTNVDELIAQVDFNSIPNWNAENGEALTRALLDNLNIRLNLDIAMKSSDTGGQPLYTRLTIEKLEGDRTLANTANSSVVKKGALLITLLDISAERYQSTDAGTSTAILYAAVDPSYTGINIWLCKNVLSLGILFDFSGALNGTWIPLDLVEKLSPLFQQLLDSLVISKAEEEISVSNVEPVAIAPIALAAEELTGFDKILAEFDILKLFRSDGIRIALRSTGTFNVEVSLNTYVVNKLLDDVMQCIFGHKTVIDLTTLGGFSDNYLRHFRWNRLDANAFFNSISGQLRDILRDVVDNILYPDPIPMKIGPLITNAILGGIKDQLQRLVRRLLPLPVYNEMSVGINIVDGTFANLYLLGYDRNEDVVNPDTGEILTCDTYDKVLRYEKNAGSGNGHRSNGLYSEVKLYNASTSVGQIDYSTDGETEGIVNWDDIKSVITIDPYEYPSGTAKNSEILSEFFSNKLAEYQYTSVIIKRNINFTIQLTEGGGYVPLDGANIATALATPGKYNVLASATFAENIVRTFAITFNVLPQTSIERVEPIRMHAYEDQPDYVTVVFSNPDGILDDRYVTRDIARSTIEGMDADYLPTYTDGNYGEQTITKEITFKNGVKATLDFEYYDSEIVELYASGSKVEIDLLSYVDIDELQAKYCPERLFFKYPDGSYGKVTVDHWDFSGLNEFVNRANTDLSGGVYKAIATVKNGTSIAQKVTIEFIIKSENILAVEVKDSVDKVIIDPYDYYMYRQGVEGYTSPYPEQITIHYGDIVDGTITNAYSKTVKVLWSGIPENYDYRSVLKGELTIKPDSAYYLGESTGTLKYTWSKTIPYTINTNIIKSIYFDEKHEKSVLEIDPLEYNTAIDNGEAYYPSKVFVEYITGKIVELPVAWTIPAEFEVGFIDKAAQFTASFGFDLAKYADKGLIEAASWNGISFLQNVKVNVLVNGSNIRGIIMDGSELSRDEKFAEEYGLTGVYEIDGIQTIYTSDGTTATNVFPKTVKILYEDLTVKEVNVAEWIFNTADITANRVTDIKVKLKLNSGATFEITCQTKDRSKPTLVQDTLSINPYNYKLDANGGIYYTEYSSNMDFTYTVYGLDGKPVYETVEGEAEPQLVTETISLPVTWDTSNVSYTYQGGLYKAYVYLGKGTVFEKRMLVMVTVEQKIIESVTYYGKGYISIPLNATNLPLGSATKEATYKMDVKFEGEKDLVAMSVITLFDDRVDFTTATATLDDNNNIVALPGKTIPKVTVIIADGLSGIYQEKADAIDIYVIGEKQPA